MPIRILPRTINSRLSALRTAKERKDATLPPDVPMMPTVQSDLDAQLPIMIAKSDAVNLAKAQQTAKSAEVLPFKLSAKTWVNHGFQALINATIRGQFPKTALSYYGLDNTAKGAPDMGTEQSILDAHAAYGAGEAARIAAGGPAIPFPAGIDIDTHVGNFRTANLQQAALKETYDNAQEDLQALLPTIDRLILKMWNGIEANFDTGDKPSMRRKAREWGVVYKPSPGEEPSPEEFSATGNVSTLMGTALADVEVTVEGTAEVVTTDANGLYHVPLLPDGTYTFTFVKMGYMPQSMPGVAVTAGKVITLDVVMEEDVPVPPVP